MRNVEGSKQGALLSDAWEGSSRVGVAAAEQKQTEGIVSVTYLHAGCCRVTHEVFLPRGGRRVFSTGEGDRSGSFLTLLIFFDRQANVFSIFDTSFKAVDRFLIF